MEVLFVSKVSNFKNISLDHRRFFKHLWKMSGALNKKQQKGEWQLLDWPKTNPDDIPLHSLHRAPPLSSIPSGGCQTLPRAHHFPPTPTPSLAPSHYTSRPPSYRSRPPSLHPGGPPSICHSRDSSDLSDSRGNVISGIYTLFFNIVCLFWGVFFLSRVMLAVHRIKEVLKYG